MLEVGVEADRLTVDHGEETVIVAVGHEEPALIRTTVRRRDPEDVLVSGAWTAADTYVLTVRFVESPFVVTATATVSDDDVVVAGRDQRVVRSDDVPAARRHPGPGRRRGVDRLRLREAVS